MSQSAQTAAATAVVDLPPLSLRVQSEPVPLEVAWSARDANDRYEAVVAVPLRAYLSGHTSPGVMNAYLTRLLVLGAAPIDVQSQPVGFCPNEQDMYLAASVRLLPPD